MEERLKALKAITAYRQLEGLGILNRQEHPEILERINALYGKHLTPLRTEQQQSSITAVGKHSEPLCDHPRDKRASIQSHGKDFCWKCGKHI